MVSLAVNNDFFIFCDPKIFKGIFQGPGADESQRRGKTLVFEDQGDHATGLAVASIRIKALRIAVSTGVSARNLARIKTQCQELSSRKDIEIEKIFIVGFWDGMDCKVVFSEVKSR